jgi:hypothetical protein
MNMLKCIYAILDAANPHHHFDLADLKGLDGAAVYAIPYQDISAAVSDLNGHPLTLSPEVALQYENILDRLMTRYSLLPMRFGTLVKNDPAVIAILQKYYPDLIRNLSQVKDKVEYGVKLLWDLAQISAQIRTRCDNETVPLKGFGRLNEASLHHQYLLKKFQELQFEEALLQKAESVIETIHTPLKELSACSKYQTMITPKIILDATYLVATDQQKTFIHTVQALEDKKPEVKFLLTGPWPPYNFIENFAEKK